MAPIDAPRPPKRARFLDEESENEETDIKLSINEEYAQRFEHNKKRAELQKCMSVLRSTETTACNRLILLLTI
jgi:hypothetical protein